MLIRITYFLQTGPSHKTLVMLIQMVDKLTYPLKSDYLSYLAIHITLPLFSNSPPNRETHLYQITICTTALHHIPAGSI